MNYRTADSKPVLMQNGTRYAGYPRMKGGKGVYVNICRGWEAYKLVLAEARMPSYNEDTFSGSMRG